MAKRTVETKEFDNGDHTVIYPIKQFINCNSTYVIYVIYCSICHKFYIGSTIRKLKVQILEHLIDIETISNRNFSGESKHFIEEHQRQTLSFSFHGLERILPPHRGGDLEIKLRDREAYWILMLGSMIPKGCNHRREVMFHY